MTDQLNLFGDSQDDTPLFSGTAQRVRADVFRPTPANQQATLFTCPICQDTGRVRVNKNRPAVRCTCQAGSK